MIKGSCGSEDHFLLRLAALTMKCCCRFSIHCWFCALFKNILCVLFLLHF